MDQAHCAGGLHTDRSRTHDNIDDILSRPDLYPTLKAKRIAILQILPIYLHRNHVPKDQYVEYHAPVMVKHEGMTDMGSRPPAAEQVLTH